jgi:eukaryotic-like serine/threonine-protein kinase
MMENISIEQLHKQFPQLENITNLKTGGQKIVYNAVHTKHGDIVLKIVLHGGNDPRILREIELIKNNSFPNVPSIYEVGTVDFNNSSFIYIFEQRITGTDLRAVLDIKDKLPLTVVLNFLSNMLNTVVKLEEQGIVHRDIKPDNILCDDQENYWLLDFGIARDLKNVSLTATSLNFGPHTAGYAAPEQYRNLKRLIDSRTDLFSIGVVAYEMLHGFNPFTKGANSIIDVYMKTESFVEDPLAIPGDKNNELAGFIQTLMQKNHTFRPPTAKMALSWFKEVMKTLSEENYK